MPPILERLVGQLGAKGMPRAEAFAVATKTLQRAGDLKPHSAQATAQGLKRGLMSPGARAKDRAAKQSGQHKAGDYKYDAKTNEARLK